MGHCWSREIWKHDPCLLQVDIFTQLKTIKNQSSYFKIIYLRDASAAFVVFDLTRRTTFEAVRKWKEDLDNKVVTTDGEKVCIIMSLSKNLTCLFSILDSHSVVSQ